MFNQKFFQKLHEFNATVPTVITRFAHQKKQIASDILKFANTVLLKINEQDLVTVREVNIPTKTRKIGEENPIEITRDYMLQVHKQLGKLKEEYKQLEADLAAISYFGHFIYAPPNLTEKQLKRNVIGKCNNIIIRLQELQKQVQNQYDQLIKQRNQFLAETMPRKPNTITFRIWHEHPPGERKSVLGRPSDGHISFAVSNCYISLYKQDQDQDQDQQKQVTAAQETLKKANPVIRFATQVARVPSADDKPGFFASDIDDALFLYEPIIDEQGQISYRYYDCEEIVFDLTQIPGLNIDAAWQWADQLLKEYSQSPTGSDGKKLYNFNFWFNNCANKGLDCLRKAGIVSEERPFESIKFGTNEIVCPQQLFDYVKLAHTSLLGSQFEARTQQLETQKTTQQDLQQFSKEELFQQARLDTNNSIFHESIQLQLQIQIQYSKSASELKGNTSTEQQRLAVRLMQASLDIKQLIINEKLKINSEYLKKINEAKTTENIEQLNQARVNELQNSGVIKELIQLCESLEQLEKSVNRIETSADLDAEVQKITQNINIQILNLEQRNDNSFAETITVLNNLIPDLFSSVNSSLKILEKETETTLYGFAKEFLEKKGCVSLQQDYYKGKYTEPTQKGQGSLNEQLFIKQHQDADILFAGLGWMEGREIPKNTGLTLQEDDPEKNLKQQQKQSDLILRREALIEFAQSYPSVADNPQPLLNQTKPTQKDLHGQANNLAPNKITSVIQAIKLGQSKSNPQQTNSSVQSSESDSDLTTKIKHLEKIRTAVTLIKQAVEPPKDITIQGTQTALFKQGLKIKDAIYWLNQQRRIAVEQNPADKDIIEFNNNSCNHLRKQYGVINQHQYFDRNAVLDGTDKKNFIYQLKQFMPKNCSNQTTLSDMITHGKASFDPKDKSWNDKPPVYKFWRWDERHDKFEQDTRAQVYNILHDNKLTNPARVKKIDALVYQRQPESWQILRRDERERYQTMALQAKALCVFDDFQQGHIDEISLIAEMANLVDQHKESLQSNNVFQFINNFKTLYIANNNEYDKDCEKTKQDIHTRWSEKLSSFARTINLAFKETEGKPVTSGRAKHAYGSLEMCLNTLKSKKEQESDNDKEIAASSKEVPTGLKEKNINASYIPKTSKSEVITHERLLEVELKLRTNFGFRN